jgi:putative DNA-invertase from lambdoid prophage Rac
MSTETKCAIWARVSTTDQHTENQLLALREWAAGRGFPVVREFVTEDSAWANGNGAKGREFEKAREEMLEGARLGQYRIVLVWALDRLSRRGYEDLSPVLQRLRSFGCELLSHQEEFIATLGPFGDVVIHMLSLMASQESERRSARIKAGLARRKAEGKPVGGRKAGAKDKRKREPRTGEAAGWSQERKDQLAARNKQRAVTR